MLFMKQTSTRYKILVITYFLAVYSIIRLLFSCSLNYKTRVVAELHLATSIDC